MPWQRPVACAGEPNPGGCGSIWTITAPFTTKRLLGLRTEESPCLRATAIPSRSKRMTLQAAHLIVAVKEAEHRPLLKLNFPAWAERVEYWHVHDLDCAMPDEALPELAAKVEELVNRLTR